MPDHISGLLSPYLRKRRFEAARPYLDRGRILDIGCGTGLLATVVTPERYLGVDLDAESIAIARTEHPNHTFQTVAEFDAEPPSEPFDTIVGLAVIEHVPSPEAWLKEMAALLKPGGRIVLTTPHPNYRRIHEFGARLRIFSREGAEEHNVMLDRALMRRTAAAADLELTHARRFLFGANQLFLLGRAAAPAAASAVPQ